MAQTIASIYKKKVLKETFDVPTKKDVTNNSNTVLKTLSENIAMKYQPQ